MSAEVRMKRDVELTLRELAGAPLPVLGQPASAVLIFERAGDALRLGLPIPSELSVWMERRTADQLAEVARIVAAELDDVRIASDDEDEDSLGFAASLRDRAESVLVGLRRAWLGRGHAAKALGTFNAGKLLDERLIEMDVLLQQVADRSRIEQALGARRRIATESGWLDRIPLNEEANKADEPGFQDGLVPLAAAAPPPRHVVMDYISRGLYSAWVESFAAMPSAVDFRQELADAVDALQDPAIDEPVSLIALRWRRKGGGGEQSPLLRVLPRKLLAAADDEMHAPSYTRSLGRLSPLEAEARVVGTFGVAELRIVAPPGEIASVHFGTSAGDLDAHGTWVARMADPAEAGSIAIRVVGTGGEVFEAEVSLAPAWENGADGESDDN